ncbi:MULTISPECIES: alpha/beta hydrolase [unclassified Rhizobium]|jgi:alpha-beta hydrolase superfamily lysophospholipase|uniref:alpha/beta hydrolase n=1 Tax=unclassified Rhizobium TaxID=2613769 RepID=UPI000646AC84|nr:MULTISPECIES: alpha/beta hydrolase [unclassified Rhizobium]MBN8952210.1 alpha/beta hydrolase [Rhizobium tropici]OJY79835.1 MAG: alpha/beta hydrolase [Rhizobium sp. 60-20]RKD66813.1 alpha-beta hydrolase superfamily lysophospholipase [Rhizobium sp. WW_1]
MFAETQRLNSPTGATLAYHHLPTAIDARGVLLISHGLAEHSRRYETFANAMAAQGFHVYAHDHRGHGETVAYDAPIGRFARRDGVEQVIADVLAMRELAASTHPGLPIILFGHSMGGLISLNAAVTYPDKFDAVTVWNSNFNPGIAGRAAQLILRTERMFKGSDVPSGPLPKLTFGTWARSIPNRRTDFDWLSRIPAQVDKYVADPLCGFDASVSLWLDIFELTFRAPQRTYLDRLSRDMPIHLVGGGKDPATDNAKAISWLANHLKGAGLAHITTEIYPDMRHETLNDIGAEQAISDFADWCKKMTAKN